MNTRARNQTGTQADAILRGQAGVPPFAPLKALIKALKTDFEFGLARKLIARTLGRNGEPALTLPAPLADNEALWLRQQLALCTYKDEELLPSARYRDALTVLEEIGLRDPKTINPETLGLGGAVYKRKFEFGGQLEDLQESMALYRAGWDRRPDGEEYSQERAYAGVNAAYALDILAARAETIARRSGTEPRLALAYRTDARTLRQAILTYLEGHFAETPKPVPSYWDEATWAEAYFGLECYPEAGSHLGEARRLLESEVTGPVTVRQWEQQTTFKQLVGLARLRQIGSAKGADPSHWPDAWKALYQFLGDDTQAAATCYRGKVGLALSGGGFRASLFHIGVLARLAEMDVLRFVEAISTVSGGSIVGAHYYLEVQRLLERQPDAGGDAAAPAITKDDYIDIVRRLQSRFLEGVQTNLRMRTLSDFGDNVRMLVTDTYTRSSKLGDLYERELYAHVDDGRQHAPRKMSDLVVTPFPKESNAGFKPKFSNWQRQAKVPVLLLNATSLNSGHNWQFTANWMGEPPGLFEPGIDIDANVRYRRLYYDEAPTDALKQFRLGHAVAASACVPGIFDPIVLEGLYPGRTVRLVDGGVHDNQGVEALLDEGCTVILCSDASGQMGDLDRPADTFIGVPLRANTILQARIREAEYQDLRGRLENRALQGLFFVHLKKDLSVAPLNWIGCDDPIPVADRSMTGYEIDRDLQRRLAAIRTDLDSFSEVEACALMTSGYLMTLHTVEGLQREHEASGETGKWGDFEVTAPRGSWSFLRLAEVMKQPPDCADRRRDDLALQLETGSGLFFKVWRLVSWLRWLAVGGGVAFAVALVWLMITFWHAKVPALSWDTTWGHVVFVLVFTAISTAVPLVRWMQPQTALRGYVMKTAVALVGWVASNVHLRIFNRMYLTRGQVDRLMRLL